MGVKIKLVGMDKLEKQLRRNASKKDIKDLVKMHGALLEESITAKATKGAAGGVYMKGYSEGNTADSTAMKKRNGGMVVQVGVGMEYDPYVEYGTRYMEAEPVVEPSAEEISKKFMERMKKLVE